MTKKCKKCGDLKELDEFPVRKDSPDGYRNHCIKCNTIYQKKWGKNEIIKKVYADSALEKQCRKCMQIFEISSFGKSKANKDGIKSYCKYCKRKESREWGESNRIYAKEYRNKNRHRLAENYKIYYKKNKESIDAQGKEYVEANKDLVSARKKAWYQKNKSKVLEGKRRRRDRQAKCEEKYTQGDERITMKAFSNKCFNCKSEDKLHIDHHRPLIKGFGLSIGNAVVLCRTCNLTKGTKNPEKFYGTKICAKLDRKLAKLNKQVSKEN